MNPTKFACWLAMIFLVAFAWHAVEINLYGYSQPSIVDTVAGLYIAWKLAGWATEEMEDEEKVNEKNGCDWCCANQHGDYTMLTFQNPNDPGTKANFSVYGGKIVLELALPGEENAQRLACNINYCPFCGRAFKR